VIGDDRDRVRGTREQVMEVVLVELSCGEGIARESFIFILLFKFVISGRDVTIPPTTIIKSSFMVNFISVLNHLII